MEHKEVKKDNVVLINDGNGSKKLLKLFLDPNDGDIYVSIVEPGRTITRGGIRICERSGNPSHGDINNGLREAFNAAINRGYGEHFPFVNPEWRSIDLKLFDANERIKELESILESQIQEDKLLYFEEKLKR